MPAITDKTLGVIVTGGSSGIGRALVEQLSQSYTVFATGRDAESLKRLESLGVGWASGDVADEAVVERQWASALAFFKEHNATVFGVCLNAGCGAGRMPFEDLTIEQIDNVLNTNVRGVMLWLRVVLPTLKAQKKGQIVLTSSVAALRACPTASLYAASKFAIHGLLLSMRAELKGTGVKMASVNPGAVATEWWNSADRGGYSERKREELSATPMWVSMITAEDVASNIVALLRQPASSNIEHIVIDAADFGGGEPPAKKAKSA